MFFIVFNASTFRNFIQLLIADRPCPLEDKATIYGCYVDNSNVHGVYKMPSFNSMFSKILKTQNSDRPCQLIPTPLSGTNCTILVHHDGYSPVSTRFYAHSSTQGGKIHSAKFFINARCHLFRVEPWSKPVSTVTNCSLCQASEEILQLIVYVLLTTVVGK